MKKIAAVCGMGFGSSFMVEMNIKNALKALNMTDVEVEHIDLASIYNGYADLYICGRDLEDNVKKYGDTVSLINIFDKQELQTKLETYLKNKGLL